MNDGVPEFDDVVSLWPPGAFEEEKKIDALVAEFKGYLNGDFVQTYYPQDGKLVIHVDYKFWSKLSPKRLCLPEHLKSKAIVIEGNLDFFY